MPHICAQECRLNSLHFSFVCVAHPEYDEFIAASLANFNRNSITTFDLSMGPYGMPISDTPNVGENPYAMTFTPDGRQLVFGNYTGVLDNNVSHASLGVLDIDEDSSNYLEVLTWIVNL